MPQTTARFGAVNNLGTTYVRVGPAVPAATVWNTLINVTNRTGAPSNFRGYIADNTWASGEPTSGAGLIAAFAYDSPIAAGQVFQVSFIVLNAGEQLVVRASVASSLDVIADGIANT